MLTSLADCTALPMAGVPRGAQGRAGRRCEAVDQRGYCTARCFSKCTPSSPAFPYSHQVLLPRCVTAFGHACPAACSWFMLPFLLQSARAARSVLLLAPASLGCCYRALCHECAASKKSSQILHACQLSKLRRAC